MDGTEGRDQGDAAPAPTPEAPSATAPPPPPAQREVGLRLAHLDDVPAIVGVLRAAFAPLRDQYTQASFDATVPTAQVIERRFGGARIWVATRGPTVVGTITARPTPTGVYAQSLAVSPDARGLGLGHLLLTAVMAFARELHAPRVYLSTTPFLHAAIRLYRDLDFVDVPDEGPHDLHGTPLRTMEHLIDPPKKQEEEEEDEPLPKPPARRRGRPPGRPRQPPTDPAVPGDGTTTR